MVDAIKPIGSISFSMWGSGTILKVIWAKPSHQIPELAMAKGMTHD